jgi:hypothetical protein
VSNGTHGPTVLTEPQWRASVAAHKERVRPWVEPRLERRAHGRAHPVDDFLFTYYSFRASKLKTWHPGVGVTCAGDAESYFVARGYGRTPDGVTMDANAYPERLRSAEWIRDLLQLTSERNAAFGCFGLHEWAMVYRQSAHQTRHASWPLRLSPAETASVVEELGLRCTHFDAFRFFTEPARPLNPVQLTRDDQPEREQPGCLHATMDLYKWAYKLSPLISSDLVADCFELAREVRTVDMQASPYDLTDLGITPIPIETPAGRADYVDRQREFADRAAPLRSRVIDSAIAVIAALTPPDHQNLRHTATVTPAQA